MALLDPTDHRAPRPDAHQRTTKPRLCLLAGFAFLVTTAVGFHYAFNAFL